MQQLIRLVFFLLVVLGLSGCGLGRYRLVYDKALEVQDRATGKMCQRVYIDFTEEGVDEAFGPPCDVLVKRPVHKWTKKELPGRN